KEGGQGDRAYLKEIDSVEHLVSNGITSKNLIRAFSLRERLKGFAKGSEFKASHLHVIGAGVMGGDIAAWCALRGIRVTLQDQTYAQIAPAIGRAHALYKKKLRKPRLIQAAMDNLIPDPEGYGIAHADVIIEAVFENLAVKQEIMKKVEKLAKKEAIIATNTSSIPLDEISNIMNNPKRLVGIHFFNPVAKMDLVEIVSSVHTSKTVELNSCAFVNQIGKLSLPVKSSPGFLVNRVLMPYLMECVQLLDEGYSAETIDEAALAFGMFMGPVELADTVGLDVGLAVAENLTAHFGGTVPQKLRDMVKEGKLGRKTGQGFYQYKNGKPVKKRPDTPIDPHIADRLILRMVNEAAACLREGVVADADLLDAGMIFATGFAPFRGGPMHYAKDFGSNNLENLFKTLESKYGERFKVDESL
ncbi:MAG: crotonase, partial [Legionella longbeachae]|nr:crotonase [Legionella longbeachae]